MASTAVLAIRIISDASQAARELGKVETATSRTSKVMGVASKAAKATLVGVGALATVSAKAASDLEQSAGAVESVFGKAAPQVERLSKAAAQSVGLAQSQYNDLAAVLGSQLKNLGIEQGKLVGTTDDLIGLGSDLAATFGGTTAEAVEALSSLLRGERDPIERYGVSIKAADVQARLAAKGMDGLTGKARTQAEAQATLALVMKQTADAQGAFAREADTAAGQQQRAAAAAKNAAAQFGMVLLPAIAKVAAMLATVAGWAAKHPKLFNAIAVAVTATAGAVLAYNAATKIAAVATGVWTAAQRALNIAMRLNPIGLVVTAVALLAAAFVVAYKKSDRFRAIVDKAAKIARRGMTTLFKVIKPIAKFIGGAFVRYWKANFRAAKAVWRGISKAARAVFKVIKPIAKFIGGAFVRYWKANFRAAKAVWRGIRAAVKAADRVISALARFVSGALSRAWSAMKRVGTGALDAVQTAVGKVKDAVSNVKRVVTDIGGKLARPFNILKNAVDRALGVIGSLLDKISSIDIPDLNPLNFAVPTPAATTTRGSLTAPSSVTINVNGALDPDAVAIQIKTLLNRYDRRAGLVRS